MKLLKLVVAFVICGFSSMAFAAEGDAPVVKGNIEIYGAAKLSVDIIETDAKATGADKSLTKVSSNSSRIGFKGTESLGDNLSAVFQMEFGVNMDGTTTSVATGVTNTTTGAVSTTSVNNFNVRNTYVGLKHNSIGTLILGTHDTPYKSSTGQFDPFSDTMGDYNSIMGNVNGSANFDLRPKDVIAYVSPTLGGATLTIAKVQTGTETASSGTKPTVDAYSASANVNAGPLAVALAYEIHKNGVASGWDSTGKMKNSGTKIGAGYTIGDTKIGLIYEALKDDNSDSAITRNAVYISVTQAIGNEKIKLAYGKAEDGKNPLTKTGATLTAVGFDHTFSKRTSAFIMYAKMKNDTEATYGLGQSGAGGAYVPAAGESPSAFCFGVVHSF